MNLRRIGGTAACAALVAGLSFGARAANLDEMAETIRALQARVEALEGRSRRDRADAVAARAELRAVKGTPRRSVPVALASAPLAPPPTVVNGFDGFYGAVIGGYQFGPTKRPENLYFTYGDDANVGSTSGGSIGASFGYNTASGPLLVGGELRARKLFDETKSSGFYQYYSGYPNYTYSNVPLSASYAREFGGDISVRVGLIFEDNLVYARVGGGADELRHVYPSFVYSGSGAVAITTKRENIASPYTLIGIGVERNFGPWFARIEGAFLNHFEIRSTAYGRDSYFTTEISSAIGYRF